MAVLERESFENCSQLVNLIRYQLGDPQEFVNSNYFPMRSYFAFSDANRNLYYNDRGVPYRHVVHFAWVILGQHFSEEVEVSEIISPILTVEGCYSNWRLNMTAIRGMGNKGPAEYDVYLTCDNCTDASIRAYVNMDLYKATDKIGDAAVTRVLFDDMVSRHLVYTGMIKRFQKEENVGADVDLSKAYTIQGMLHLINCCVDQYLQ